MALIRSAEMISTLADLGRTVAIEAFLPPSERGALRGEAATVETFVNRHRSDADLAVLEDTIRRMVSPAAAAPPPQIADVPSATPARAARRKKTCGGRD